MVVMQRDTAAPTQVSTKAKTYGGIGGGGYTSPRPGTASEGSKAKMPPSPWGGGTGGVVQSGGTRPASIFGGGPPSGGGGGGGATPPVPGAATSTAAPNPFLEGAYNNYTNILNNAPGADPLLAEHTQMLRERMSTDTTGRAIDRAGLAIGDQAAGAQQANLEKDAVFGGGGAAGAARIGDAAMRAQAGSAADIALGREKDLDAMVMGAGGIMGAQGNRQLAVRGQNLAAAGGQVAAGGAIANTQLGQQGHAVSMYQAQLQAEAERVRAQTAQQNAMVDQYRSIWS